MRDVRRAPPIMTRSIRVVGSASWRRWRWRRWYRRWASCRSWASATNSAASFARRAAIGTARPMASHRELGAPWAAVLGAQVRGRMHRGAQDPPRKQYAEHLIHAPDGQVGASGKPPRVVGLLDRFPVPHVKTATVAELIDSGPGGPVPLPSRSHQLQRTQFLLFRLLLMLFGRHHLTEHVLCLCLRLLLVRRLYHGQIRRTLPLVGVTILSQARARSLQLVIVAVELFLLLLGCHAKSARTQRLVEAHGINWHTRRPSAQALALQKAMHTWIGLQLSSS